MSEFDLFIKRVGLVGLVQIVVNLRGIIILPIMTKTLIESDYGIWAIIVVTPVMVRPFLHLGLDNAILRFLSSKGKKESVQGVTTAFCVVLLTGSIVSLLVFLCSSLISETFLDGDATSVVKLAAPLILLEGLNSLLLGSFRVFHLIRKYSVMLLLQTVLEVGLLSFFVLSGHGLIGAVLSFIIARAVTLVISLYLITSYAGFAAPDFSVLRTYMAYGLPLIATIVFGAVMSFSDRYVIGFFEGTASVGIYSAAYNLGAILLVFAQCIMFVLGPTLFSLYDQGKVDEVKKYLEYSWKYLLMLSIPSFFGLWALAKPVLGRLTQSEYVSDGQYIVPLIALGVILFGIARIFLIVVQLSKNSMAVAIVFSIGGLMNVVLNIIFVPIFGIVAAAVTTIVSYATVTVIMYQKSLRQVRFGISPGFILKSILASVVMAMTIWLIDPGQILWEIALCVIVGALIYFTMLLLLGGLSKNEIRFVVQLVGRR